MKTQASRSLSAQSRSSIRHSKDTEIASNMITRHIELKNPFETFLPHHTNIRSQRKHQ